MPTILDVCCRLTGLRFAAVARVTETRWIACAVRDQLGFGLTPGGELELKTTICDEIRQSGKAVVIDQVSAHAHFCTHHTPRQYGFESYISIPIHRVNGEFFGTLCALDPLPAKLDDPQVIQTFELFAKLISLQLDSEQRLQQSQAELLHERHNAQLREQFIAVLGHDLRTPLAVVMSGAEVLLRLPLPATGHDIATRVLRSADRMARLVDNILDFARGKLGSGIQLHKHDDQQLGQALQQVITELATVHAQRHIDVQIQIDRSVSCDTGRIAQLLSNLLGNALTHGSANGPVTVRAATRDGEFTLQVENRGTPIAAEILPQLFQPFTRFSGEKRSGGLGLGLYIAAQIAQAHNGSLRAESAGGSTRFLFSMPL
ncbi:GAF domain-containing sensor histidine kinase [Hydrocarboniphaga sp.]|uniref:GAF domain-containing sensor histidine kinase n=1 Tax=Hydrocarboniphaga sp. TaxID=2033016 RepID=UPI003D14C892